MSNLMIGEKIKAKRRELNLTQEELANILGLTKAAVCKWEKSESYPDITILPQIARLFNITMDELFGYSLGCEPLRIVNQYNFGLSLDSVDRRILDHGTVNSCSICRCDGLTDKSVEGAWEVRVHLVSTEENFPYILQNHLKQGILVDGYSVRIVGGKVVEDDNPDKHYVCSEKVWEYNHKDSKYIRRMLKEQADMGLIEEDYD